MNATKTIIITLLTAALVAVTLDRAHAKGPPIRVTESIPAMGEQGTTIATVRLRGKGFVAGPQIRYYRSGTETPAPPGRLEVSDIDVDSSGEEIRYKLVIGPDADPGDYDIEVFYSSSRKGKGTTLFNVQSKDGTQPNECMYDFEAYFDDAESDGVYSDGLGSYVAFGGTGMRLDTNGSQKLERRNDTRFVWIDFRANGVCQSWNAQNPAGATGFCSQSKGVDMRIEHQVQERQGLCSIEPPDGDMLQTVRIQFLGGPDSTPLLEEIDLNGNGGSSEPAGFHLNYGCQGPRIDPLVSQAHENDRVRITRLDNHTWIFEGWYACVTSQLGNIMVDDSDPPVPIRVYMPFALCIVDVKAPQDNCRIYLDQLIR